MEFIRYLWNGLIIPSKTCYLPSESDELTVTIITMSSSMRNVTIVTDATTMSSFVPERNFASVSVGAASLSSVRFERVPEGESGDMFFSSSFSTSSGVGASAVCDWSRAVAIVLQGHVWTSNMRNFMNTDSLKDGTEELLSE